MMAHRAPTRTSPMPVDFAQGERDGDLSGLPQNPFVLCAVEAPRHANGEF